MRTLTLGEFYVWYCEWCDSRNLTPWVGEAKVCCGGCHKEYGVAGAVPGNATQFLQTAQV